LDAFDGTGFTLDTLPYNNDGKNHGYIVNGYGENESQTLRTYINEGCEFYCDTTALNHYTHPGVNWIDAFLTYNLCFSPGFTGGEAGGKITGFDYQPTYEDTVVPTIFLMFEAYDSTLKWYMYDQNTPGYGESVSTPFKFLTGKWYNITIRVYFDDASSADGFAELYIDGKHISSTTGWDFTGPGINRGVDEIPIQFFFGGGGPATQDVWLEYDDFSLWRPTSAARTAGILPAEGAQVDSGSIIPVPGEIYMNEWYNDDLDEYYYRDADTTGSGGEDPDPECADSTVFASHTTGQDDYVTVTDGQFGGQTFTISDTTELIGVNLYLYTNTNPGDLEIDVYADSSGAPTGNSLSSGSVNYTDVPSSFEWVYIDLTDVTLNPGNYVIVARAPSAPQGTWFRWGMDTDNASYADGYVIVEWGEGWNTFTSWDFLFELYESVPCESTASGRLPGYKGQRKLYYKGREATLW
jgi:hypothetical protein